MIDAVIYVRRYFKGVIQKIESCEEWCASNGLHIHARYVEDNFKGHINDRHLLNLALIDIEKKRARFFVSHSMYDWMIDFQPGIDIVEHILSYKGVLISLEEDIDTRTEEGMDSFYKMITMGRYMNAMREEAEISASITKKTRQCPGAYDMIKKLWKKGRSPSQIKHALNKSGIPYNGFQNRWNPKTIVSILKMLKLRNPEKIKITREGIR